MASYDADPLFLKGLRLLHSKAKDSADQLRQLLEDVLNQKYSSGGLNNQNLFTTKEIKGHITLHKQVKDYEPKGAGSKKTSPKHSNESSSQSSKSSATIMDEPKKKEAEKRHFEKLKQELTELCYESKRSKTADSSQSSLSSSPSPQPTIKIEEYSISNLTQILGKSDSVNLVGNITETGGSGDAEDFAMEMGLACVVCSKLEVTPRNRLIECQECHSLYHQECHKPSVTDNEVNDPRHVWYCVRCTKSMRKASKSQKSAKSSASSPVTIREPIVPTRSIKSVDLPAPSLPSLLPFKRSEIKASSASHGSNSGHSSNSNIAAVNKPIGLAGLAANFNARTTTPSASSSSSSLMASKSNFGSTKGGLSSLATSKPSSSFSSQSSSSSGKSGKSFSAMSGLASLASAAAVVAKSSSTSSRSSGGSSSSSSGSTNVQGSSTSSGPVGNGGNGTGTGSGSGKSSASSSLMSADKRLQIMKKKAAAKMQEKRRLSSK